MGEQNQAETIGQYRLTECRAEGRIARICRGVDRSSGQTVLVRIVNPLASQNEQIRAILEELRDPNSERRVQDPHILRLLDVGLKGDSYYIIHEDFGGVPLDEHLQKGRVNLRDGLRLAMGISECLRAIHGHRIVHGDLKPQNILVGTTKLDRPYVKIALSDLAHEAADSMVSVYGEMVGTPKYMAPEVLRGGRATAQSDMFSLGVVLYELFSGRAPFPGDTPISFVHANISMTPAPLAMADPALPADLSRVVDRLLAREPRNRYRTVQGVIDDLERVMAKLDGTVLEPAPMGSDSAFAPAPEAAQPSGNPWRVVAVLALAACVVLLVIIVATQLKAREMSGVKVISLEEAQNQPEGPGILHLEPTPQEQIEQIAAKTPVDEAEELIKSGKEDEAIQLLQSATPSDKINAAEIEDKAAEALLSKARNLDQAGKFEEAQKLLEAIMADYPSTPAASTAMNYAAQMLFDRAQLLAQRGRLEEALAYMEKIQTLYSRSDVAYKSLQMLPPMRIRLAESLISTDPDRAEQLLRQVAFSQSPAEDLSKARAILARYLLDKSDTMMRRRLYQDAVLALRDARRLEADLAPEVEKREPEALGQLAINLQRQGKPAEAVIVFKELQERYPAHLWVARARVALTPLLEATEGLKPGEKVEDAGMLMSMAEKAMETGGFPAAQQNLEQLVRSYPDTPQGKRAADLIADNLMQSAAMALQSADIEQTKQLLSDISTRFPRTRAGATATSELAKFQAAPAGMAYVPAGPCTIGLSEDQVFGLVKEFNIPRLMVPRWFGQAMPSYTANVKGFYIDIHEVTNAQYKTFLAAAGGRDAPKSPDWDGENVRTGAERLPVRYVSWDDARAYASWAGKRLPTEVEWEKATRGPNGLLFPWGNNFDSSLCMSTGQDGPQEVGAIPGNRSPYGLYDTVGNVQEWTQDVLAPYPGADRSFTRFDDTHKVARGSGWDEINSFFCLAAMRFSHFPDNRTASLGFRCVMDIE